MHSFATPRCRRWLLGLLAATGIIAWAGKARAADRGPWDFTLPTLAGDRFVQVSKLSGPVLVNFWGRDCAPCVAELPLLQGFAQAEPGWTILLVCTDPPPEARVFLQKHQIALLALKSGANVEALMRAAGNRSGGLPFTVVLRGGRICTTHEGGLSETALKRIRMECSTNQARPTGPSGTGRQLQAGLELRDGSGVGVNAAQFGMRRGLFGSVGYKF